MAEKKFARWFQSNKPAIRISNAEDTLSCESNGWMSSEHAIILAEEKHSDWLVAEKKMGKDSVVVAMSGGVDSSVAAALLLEQGYDVTGVILDMWRSDSNAGSVSEPVKHASKVADQLNIPLAVLDARDIFYSRVVIPFIENYMDGLTPSPCVGCNRFIKWQSLVEFADAEKISLVATGHYARIRVDDQGTAHLLKGLDPQKDQAYMLSFLSQEQLSRSIFPIGAISKPEIRQIARKLGLVVAERDDSQDLCFLPSGDYRQFLREYAQDEIIPGAIVDTEGNVLGRHEGLSFYTIGQRKGLGIYSPAPLYVLEKDTDKNRLVVGQKDALGRGRFYASSFNWITGQPPERLFRAQIKIRYRAPLTWGSVQIADERRLKIDLEKDLDDITPGQVAVIYRDDEVLGGGVIEKT